ncbi:phospholipid:diacylglycerol acyltransferase [Wickerhamomyces ciferrii]|uniref:Phospholipid:diacylglycerol acyltransferase n=1 Tax=Wickerhamomyces ciferrii (strain ATCC 14091 / BCRC 22168 / CBS 111 / JCM 3599 / NBRC 0793 / NRRL Y-1031 F-60-10) TaxID=1206466 RepID=K0K8D6_WICCF|nr:phospholipid:diacylglycerol acyltransferase [Wickerhamomyces ciferrii]CCH41105.1 phospholipid:diacylglycerol acyltransferase [Wickerhamomyces ciferrii]
MAIKKRANKISKQKKEENAKNDVIEVSEVETDVLETSTDDDQSKHVKKHKTSKKKVKESKRIVFLLGAFVGILIALYFGAKQNGNTDFDKLVNFESLQDYLDDWKEVLPSGLQNVLSEFNEKSPGEGKDFSEDFAVGKAMKLENGLEAKYPVVMIPGVISTGIESWGLEGTKECPSQHHFRKRLWGSMYMLRTMFLDKACWLKHIMLDEETGLDPPGIKLRAAQGFESADFFMAGYWIWNKILQNLAAIGYEPNKMVTASYDWRLSYLDLERRDQYFSRLQQQCELRLATTGEKSVLVGHSMGSQIAFYFMKWVEAEGNHFGNGGRDWVNKHIAAFIDISGSVLGAPKAIPALISGEMKDTVQLNTLAVYGLEKFFSRRERLDMLRTFGGVASMLPKGGDLIWGNLEGSIEDSQQNNSDTFGNFIRFEKEVGTFSSKNLTMADSIDFVLDNSPEWFNRRTREHYSYGVASTPQELKENEKMFNKWSNPLEVPLPNAPDLKVYCFYGVGNPTERAYAFQEEENKDLSKLNVSIVLNGEKPSVFFTDGDGTIPVLTHAMCHKWKTSPNYNPGNSQVKIVEMKHDPDRFDIRGGAKTAEHVDILGSAELNELVLKVASGRDDLITERVITNMTEWVANMDFGFE